MTAEKNSTIAAKSLAVALYQPQIPPNTGNIGRLCVGFGVPLYLIGDLGFSMQDRALKRAGLDYWPHLDVELFQDFDDFWQKKVQNNARCRVFCLSTKGSTLIETISFQKDDILLFGNETSGFPQEKSDHYNIERIKLPMSDEIRSYNLANAAAMSLYAAHICLHSR